MKPRKTFYGVTFYPFTFKLLPLWTRRKIGAVFAPLVKWRYSGRAKGIADAKEQIADLVTKFTYSEDGQQLQQYLDNLSGGWNPLGRVLYNPFNFITSLYYYHLYQLVRKTRPDVAVESGVFLGGSSYAILEAMEENGKGELFSIDISPNATVGDGSYSFPTGYAVSDDLRERWKLIIEDSRTCLPELLGELRSIDFFVHDSDHSYATMKFEMEQGYDHLREGGVMVVDDASTSLAVYDFALERHLRPWIVSRDGIYPDNLAVFVK